MSSAQKIIQAAAGNAAGEATYVEDVFSTYLYDGTGSAQTITNGIDLDGEGGMVWTKRRDSTTGAGPWIADTERGITKYLGTYATSAETDNTGGLSAVSSTGYTLGTFAGWNASGGEYASWTFRKAPKFFDVVTYTGDGTSGQTVSHSLNATPGMIIVKRTDSTSNWAVAAFNGTNYDLLPGLNLTNARLFTGSTSNYTSTEFKPYNLFQQFTDVPSADRMNVSGATYVAYLFAHNDGDGIFGENGDQDIIKCGSYTGNGSADGPEIDLSFEPQWILIKNTDDGTDSWVIVDNMRGMVANGSDQYLTPNASDQEYSNTLLTPTATGFKINQTFGLVNGSGENLIYIAIRRGPMKTPESGTEVFAIDTLDGSTEPAWDASFDVVDMALRKYNNSNSDWLVTSRLTQGKKLKTNSTSSEVSDVDEMFDYMYGWSAENGTSANFYSWMFRRAPGFFDVVAYTGTGSSQTLNHNLGVAPEMIIVKRRNGGGSESWVVQHSGLTGGIGQGANSDYIVYLNSTNSELDSDGTFNFSPTTTTFSLQNNPNDQVNNASGTYIAYLFATLPGVSKVGSYTGNGTSQTIDCGFSPRFLLIKKALNGTGGWFVFDTERGIVAGNDPYLFLNTTDAENTGADTIDPVANGFIVNDNNTNANTDGYIFLAIA